MMKFCHVFVPLSLLTLPTTEARSSSLLFLPRGAREKTSVLENSIEHVVKGVPRGGGVPFDIDLAQKLFVGAYGMNAALHNFSPSLALKAYQLPPDAASERLMQTSGSVGMVHTTLLYLQLYQGMSFEKAIGWSVWPWLLTVFYQASIAKSDRFIAYPSKNHLPSSIFNLLVFFGSQTEASWAGSLNRLYGYFSLANGIPALLFCKPFAKANQISLKTAQSRLLLQSFGYFLLAHGITVVICADKRGYSLSHAIGWSAVALATSLAGLVLTGQLDTAGVPKGLAAVWVLLLAAIANSLLGFV